jgi:hypothetical protein
LETQNCPQQYSDRKLLSIDDSLPTLPDPQKKEQWELSELLPNLIPPLTVCRKVTWKKESKKKVMDDSILERSVILT